MDPKKLPKVVRSAVNRAALRIALTKAYDALRAELEVRALERWHSLQPAEAAVVHYLERIDPDVVPRSIR